MNSKAFITVVTFITVVNGTIIGFFGLTGFLSAAIVGSLGLYGIFLIEDRQYRKANQ
jgi:hypothetical protein